METLGLSPILDLEMRLGEGSGCPIAFEVIDAALTVLREMGTFADAKIDDAYLAEIRRNARLQR
jgi:nicotinate-nucleotide--dimethylbenzimidazole phosphoribosyltransferase